jgi:hypothetical protein
MHFRPVLLLGLFLVFGIAVVPAQPFLPPGMMHPQPTPDGDDLFVHHVVDRYNRIHAVWATQTDYDGSSGNDPDIYYMRFDRGGWCAPQVVNSYGHGDLNDDERDPRVAVGPDGVIHCVWSTNSPHAGTGFDRDILYSRNDGSGWSTAVPVNSYATTEDPPWVSPHDDNLPNLVVCPDGRVVAAWQSEHPLSNGADLDIHYSILQGATWSPAASLNSNAATDTGDDLGPVRLLVSSDGSVYAVWSTNDDFRVLNPVGSDYDIVFAVMSPAGSWGMLSEVCANARSDSGDDRFPAAVLWENGPVTELHVVWQSTDDVSGSGTDTDILHAAVGWMTILPLGEPAGFVNSETVHDGAARDEMPSLCIEPGGVLHCAWQSQADPATGSDFDIFHATNASRGSSWSQAELIGLNGYFDQPGENDERPTILCAPNGVMSVAWQSNDDLGGLAGPDRDIFHAFGSSRGVTRPEWINSTARNDSGGPQNWDLDSGLSVAVDPENRLHAVWFSDCAALAGGGTGGDADVFHAILEPEGWGPAELVNTNGETDSGRDYYSAMAIGTDGRVHVVWASEENIGGTVGNDWDIFYAVRDGSGWSAPEPADSEAGSDQNSSDPNDDTPALAVGEDGTVFVAWLTDQGGEQNLSFAQRGPGGWSPAILVENSMGGSEHYDPFLILDSQQRPHILWSSDADYNSAGSDSDVFHAWRDQGTWSVEFVNDAANDSGGDRTPDAVFDSQGRLLVVWTSHFDVEGAGTDPDLFYSLFSDSGSTIGRLLLDWGRNDTGEDWNCDLAFDRNGQLHLVWQSSDPLGSNQAGIDFDIAYAVIAPEATFPAVPAISLANASGYGSQEGLARDQVPQILIDDRGYVHFAWESADSLGDDIGEDYDLLYARRTFPLLGAYARSQAWSFYR